MGKAHRTKPQNVDWLRERSSCSRLLKLSRFQCENKSLKTQFTCNLIKNADERLLRPMKSLAMTQKRRFPIKPEMAFPSLVAFMKKFLLFVVR